MTIAELRAITADVDGEMLIGVPDQDDTICEVQTATVVSSAEGYGQYFLIRANGGYPLFSS